MKTPRRICSASRNRKYVSDSFQESVTPAVLLRPRLIIFHTLTVCLELVGLSLDACAWRQGCAFTRIYPPPYDFPTHISFIMPKIVDNLLLLYYTPAEIAQYFRGLLAANGSADITADLLAATASDAIPPRTFSIWLAVSPTPETILLALHQDHSLLIRSEAIRRFSKIFRTTRWKQVWNTLGGTAGLVDIFSRLSVSHVGLFCQAITSSSTSPPMPERAKHVTELLKVLLDAEFRDSVLMNTDKRPLTRVYAQLLPACASDFVETLLPQDRQRLLNYVSPKGLACSHPEVFQRLIRDSVLNETDMKPDGSKYMKPILTYFPDRPGKQPGFTVSMEYSLELLRDLSASDNINISSNAFMQYLADPLLKRAMRRKASGLHIIEILHLVAEYLRRHPEAIDQVSTRKGGFVSLVIRLWSRKRVLYEPPLVALLEMLPNSRTRIEAMIPMMEDVMCSARYPLLRLSLLGSKVTPIDVENEADLASEVIPTWPAKLFAILPRSAALSLLRRIANARSNQDFLGLGSASSVEILHHPPSPGAGHGDLTALRIWLEQAEDGAQTRAESTVDARQKKATTSREQSDRAFYAKSAIMAAVASGSLDQYGETLLWTRRYIRDALSIKVLYSQPAVSTKEGVDLLCGFPARPPRDLTAEKVGQDISKANNILQDLLETALMALREPSFQARDWRPALGLIREVVEARLCRVATLHHRCGISDTDIYDAVWKDTLMTVTAIETKSFQPGHERLEFRDLQGPVHSGCYGVSSGGKALPSSFRFLDELARGRDALWQHVRKSLQPSVTTLPQSWPRGLPIQYLSYPDIITGCAEGEAPYITARAEEIVFVSPEFALSAVPDDEDTKAAIGVFIDQYTLALQIYLSQSSNAADRQRRIAVAWKHAMSKLTGSRMTPEEARRFWQARTEYFHQIGSDKGPVTQYPTLPSLNDPDEPTEWCAADGEPSEIKKRALNPVCIDWLLTASTYLRTDANTPRHVAQLHTQAVTPENIWSLSSLGRFIPTSTREGLIASAMLFLDSRKGGQTRILSKSFPRRQSPRFPALFLDQDFLLRSDLAEADALSVIKSLSSDVPPLLLKQLSEAVLEALFAMPPGSTDVSQRERTAYTLLSILASSDRPYLAFDMLIHAIIDRPDASSWHRKLLPARFFARLSSEEARDFVSRFADIICEKLRGQRKRRLKDPKSSPDAAKPSVKITTVKALAQLLRDAKFVPDAEAIEVLTRILEASSHIDARVAVVDSLLSMLASCQDESPLCLRLQEALKVTIPIAGSVDERRPISEQEWVSAINNDELPLVYDDGGPRQLPPIVDKIVQNVRSLGTSLSLDKRMSLFCTILLPVIELSKAYNIEWTSIFLKKHGFTVLAVPALPVKPYLLSYLLRHATDILPFEVVEAYRAFVEINMSPSPGVAAVNRHVLESAELRASNEGRHWLELYGQGIAAYGHGGFHAASLMRTDVELISDDVDLSVMQTLVFNQARAILDRTDESLGTWSKFVKHLEPPVRHRQVMQEAWNTNGRPVIERIVQYLRNIRDNPAWQKSANRRPRALPSTLDLELWLLSYPNMPWKTEIAEQDALCRIFAGQLSEMLNVLASSNIPCHEPFEKVKSAALKVFESHRAVVACHLPYVQAIYSMDSPPGLKQYLHLELADMLIRGAQEPRESRMIEVVKDVLARWCLCEVEEIRMKGMRTVRILSDMPPERNWFRGSSEKSDDPAMSFISSYTSSAT